MQTHARVIIIGGGAVGASALYHLATRGWADALLIERDELTAGSTWHAAGNCPNFSTSWNTIKFQRHSTRLYATLGDTVGYPINYHVTGSIRLAHSRNRMDEYAHVTAMARAQGLDFALLSPAEIETRYPFIALDDIEGGLLDPFDGDIDPSQLTQAFAKGARDMGAKIERFTKVTAISPTASGGWRVTTDKGDVTCEFLVNAAGYRAGEIMAMVGRYLPIVSMSHQYLVTEPIAELSARKAKLPLLRDPDVSYYLRQERDGLLLGPYEWRATPHWLDGLPDDFAHQLYPDDLERLERYIEAAIARVPILGSVGVQRVINGPIPYSPDGNPYIGPAHGLKNFFQCCCFSFGIAQAGGAGKTIAEWLVDGEPEWDFWGFDPRRYAEYATKRYVVAKAVELYQNEYAIAYPQEERPAGRPAKTTALYGELKRRGAYFCARGGWERAAYFPRPGDPEPKPSFRRAETGWHEAVAAECKAVRERVGLLDLGGFSKFVVEGPGAESWLDRVICGRLPKLGRISLTWALNAKGGIVSEFTITRLAPQRFLMISAAVAEDHDRDLLEATRPTDGSVKVQNRTARWGTLVLAGPRARDVLARVTEADLSNATFPWLSARTLVIGHAPATALRVNYVGELGWELHMPMEHMAATYALLREAGEPHGLADFGMYAMESLRLEKGYRSWKSDLTTEYTPLMAGLERFVAFDKGDFAGKAALVAERARGGARERLVTLALDAAGDAEAPYCAPVFAADANVGLTVSAAYGHALKKSLALAYVRGDLARLGGKVEVEIYGARRAATIVEDSPYDPTNARLRA